MPDWKLAAALQCRRMRNRVCWGVHAIRTRREAQRLEERHRLRDMKLDVASGARQHNYTKQGTVSPRLRSFTCSVFIFPHWAHNRSMSSLKFLLYSNRSVQVILPVRDSHHEESHTILDESCQARTNHGVDSLAGVFACIFMLVTDTTGTYSITCALHMHCPPHLRTCGSFPYSVVNRASDPFHITMAPLHVRPVSPSPRHQPRGTQPRLESGNFRSA